MDPPLLCIDVLNGSPLLRQLAMICVTDYHASPSHLSLSLPGPCPPKGEKSTAAASVDEIRAQNLLSFALLPSCYKPGEGGTLRSSFRAHLHA